MVVGSIYNPFNPISYMVLVGKVVFHFKDNNLASQKKWLSVRGLPCLGVLDTQQALQAPRPGHVGGFGHGPGTRGRVSRPGLVPRHGRKCWGMGHAGRHCATTRLPPEFVDRAMHS